MRNISTDTDMQMHPADLLTVLTVFKAPHLRADNRISNIFPYYHIMEPFQVRIMEQKLAWSQQSDANTAQISRLEGEIEEQRQLRLQDARQVEAKAARIKEWVTNKLRELEQQNQTLKEQNIKCNQQLELLRNHLALADRRR